MEGGREFSRVLMYKIEHFGHALALAFGLSAVLYYIELREIAEARLKIVLDAHKEAELSGSVIGTAARQGKDAYQAILAVLDGESAIQPG